MKKLQLKHISSSVAASIKAIDVPALLDREGIEPQAINQVNWPDTFPYAPQVTFRMAYTDEALLLHYVVKEESVRSVAGQDNGPV